MVMVSRRRKVWRRGAAAVEAAIIMPVLLLVTFGAIRYGWFFLKAQQITNAARYGARVAIRADATVAQVQSAIDGLFAPNAANITGATVTFWEAQTDGDGNIVINGDGTFNWIPSVFAVGLGVPIKVTITVPAADVDIMPLGLFDFEPDGWNLGASTTMAKEGF